MRAIRVYPLFFLVLVLVLIIPSSVHADSILLRDTQVTASLCDGACVSPNLSVRTGDFVLVHAMCEAGSGGVNSVTDTFGDIYTNIITNSRGTMWAATSVAGNAIAATVTFSNCNFSGSPAGTFSVESFSGVASLGNTVKQLGCTGGCTDTITITTKINNAAIYEGFDVYGGGLGSCPTITNVSGQTTTQTLNCLNGLASAFSVARTVYKLNIALGGNSFQMSTSASQSTGHEIIELDPAGGAPSNLGTQTACYGNCGNPAVTLVNTNSTHSINFNQSQTIFYEFQSNLNGFVLNETVNVAKTYSNGQQVALGIYIATCVAGVTPFTAACPGQQRAVTISNPNPLKGRFNLIPTNPIAVSNGQWVAIAVTSLFSGLDLNDTNTNVSIFQQTPGTIPPLLNNGASFNCACKIGMWTYITGNTVTSPPPLSQVTQCGADLVCILTGSILALTPSNPLLGAIFYGFVYSIFTTFALAWATAKAGHINLPGGVYLFIWVGWFTFFASLVGAIWFIILEMLAVVAMFTLFFSSLAQGSFRHGRSDA